MEQVVEKGIHVRFECKNCTLDVWQEGDSIRISKSTKIYPDGVSIKMEVLGENQIQIK